MGVAPVRPVRVALVEIGAVFPVPKVDVFGVAAEVQGRGRRLRGFGLLRARGEIVVTLDGDLQNDPIDIPILLEKFDEGYDIVSGWRRDRHDDLLTSTVPSEKLRELALYGAEVVKIAGTYGMSSTLLAAGAFGGAMTAANLARRAGSSTELRNIR